VPTFADVTWSAQRIITAVNLGFLDRIQKIKFNPIQQNEQIQARETCFVKKMQQIFTRMNVAQRSCEMDAGFK
jgi:hypothetical protein